MSESMTDVTPARTGFAASSAGAMNAAPSLPRAAFAFATAPGNVSPVRFAAPPIPESMAFANVAKSISPFETIFDTSALVFPSCFPSIWSTGTPELISWSMSSPWSLPRAATDPKIVPMSVRDRPEIAATSATVDSVDVISLPFFTPAAAIIAATEAASPRP
nr:hypothetical protein [Tessaracoccus sp.]